MRTLVTHTLIVLLSTLFVVGSAAAAPRAQALTKKTYATANAAARAGGAYALSRKYKTPFHASDLDVVGKGKTSMRGAERLKVADGNNFAASINVVKARGGWKADKNSARTAFIGIE